MAQPPSPGSTSEHEMDTGSQAKRVELVPLTNDDVRPSAPPSNPSWFTNSNTSIDQSFASGSSQAAFFDRSYADLSAFGRGSSTSFLNLPFDFSGRSSGSFNFLLSGSTPSQQDLPPLFLDSNSRLQLQQLGPRRPSSMPSEPVDQYLDPSLGFATSSSTFSSSSFTSLPQQQPTHPSPQQHLQQNRSSTESQPPQQQPIQQNLQDRAPGYTPSHPFDLNTVMTAPGVPMGPVERFHFQQQMVEGPDFSSTLHSLASTLPPPTIISNGRTLESVGGGLHFQRNYPRRLVLGEEQYPVQQQQNGPENRPA